MHRKIEKEQVASKFTKKLPFPCHFLHGNKPHIKRQHQELKNNPSLLVKMSPITQSFTHSITSFYINSEISTYSSMKQQRYSPISSTVYYIHLKNSLYATESYFPRWALTDTHTQKKNTAIQ